MKDVFPAGTLTSSYKYAWLIRFLFSSCLCQWEEQTYMVFFLKILPSFIVSHQPNSEFIPVIKTYWCTSKQYRVYWKIETVGCLCSAQCVQIISASSKHQSRLMPSCPGSPEGADIYENHQFPSPPSRGSYRAAVKAGWTTFLVSEGSLSDHNSSNTQMSVELAFSELARPSLAIWWSN